MQAQTGRNVLRTRLRAGPPCARIPRWRTARQATQNPAFSQRRCTRAHLPDPPPPVCAKLGYERGFCKSKSPNRGRSRTRPSNATDYVRSPTLAVLQLKRSGQSRMLSDVCQEATHVFTAPELSMWVAGLRDCT
jgi:hypothetical protein